MIRQETAFQAILARNFSEVRTTLGHLKCDLLLLTDDTFPEEDLERLYLLPEDVEPPELLSLTFHSWTSNHRDGRDVRSTIKAMKLLLAGSSCPSLLGSDGRRT
jgi:hypothetical protein